MCELDLVFNFQAAHFLLDEMIIGGELVETSKKAVLKYSRHQDEMEEQEKHQPK